MSNEDSCEDRLTKTEFAELIQHLSAQEIVAIEYRIGKNWRKLFTRKHVASNVYVCNLCTVDTSSFKNLLAHIDGRKHKLQMDRVQQLYHPDYTHPKNEKKEQTEKSAIATKTNSNKNVITLSNKNQTVKSTTPVISGPKNDLETPLVVIPVVAEKNIKNIKSTIENKANDDKLISKTTNDSNNIVETKELKTNAGNKGNLNPSTKNNTNSVQEEPLKNRVSSTPLGEEQKGTDKLATNSKQLILGSNDQSNQSKQTGEGSAAKGKQSVDSTKESTAKQTSLASLVKNPFALKNQENKKLVDKNKDNEPTKESVKITIPNKEVSSKNSQKNSTMAKDGKRALTTDTSENKTTAGGTTEAKKAKIVLNPAAALSENVSSSNNEKAKRSQDDKEDKPQYQMDKIIIPTKHKSSSKSSKEKESPSRAASTLSSSSQNKDLPQFSVKTYSSKPSDNDVCGILGVEYVIKILKNRSDISPRYECGLCELVLDGFAMQRHLEGYSHRLKFCEKHFPTAIRHYRQYMNSVPEHEVFKVLTPVLAKLATAIEKHHGRNLPYECLERDFSLNRHEVLAKAFSCRHASEQYGPTFTHVVGAKEIDEYINGRHRYIPPTTSRSAIFDKAGISSRLDSRHSGKDSATRDRHRHAGRGESSSAVSSAKHAETTYKSYMSSTGYSDLYPPSNAYSQPQPVVSEPVVQQVDDETYKLMVEDFLKGTLKGISTGRSRDPRKRSASPAHSTSLAKRKSLSPLRQNDIWQAYRHMVDQELNNLDERFKEYRKDPETHPSYNEEWQKFWKRRKDELISAGLDHRKYNYQPEWVRFIKVRIEELFSQEVENLKIKSRERLCLPMTNNNLSDLKYHVQAPKMNSPDVVMITSDPINAVRATNSTMTTSSSNSLGPTLSLDVDAPQVVAVLRLMTALEENLGSLGPKIIDILSKALQAEKSNPTQVNAIILNNENCVVIETAKEKLKGLVIAGLFEGSKNRVLKKVVKDTEALLSYAQQFRRAPTQSEVQPMASNFSLSSTSAVSAVANVLNAFKNPTPIQNTGGTQSSTSSSSSIATLLTQVDKKELASKLAASLVAQGKTDFDPQQLQQLIAVYTLIEKKKRTANATSNKGNSMSAVASSSKKTLSDMLSDLLKPNSLTSASTNKNISVSKHHSLNTTAESAYRMSKQSAADGLSSNTNMLHQSNFSNAAAGAGYPSNASTFTSVSQNSGGNYFSNTSQPTDNAIGVRGGGSFGGPPTVGGHVGGYGSNYSNNLFPSYQQNPNPSDMYNSNQYQNNMAQNWNWNPNTGTNPNYNMGGQPSNSNQPSNWRNF